jgi:hypothetical protein
VIPVFDGIRGGTVGLHGIRVAGVNLDGVGAGRVRRRLGIVGVRRCLALGQDVDAGNWLALGCDRPGDVARVDKSQAEARDDSSRVSVIGSSTMSVVNTPKFALVYGTNPTSGAITT